MSLLTVVWIILCCLCWIGETPASEIEMKYLSLFYSDQDLMVTATRYPRPVSDLAENVEIVTAEEIEKMNAHTMGEVLARVTGILAVTSGRDFGSDSIIGIQGSDTRHVRVVVDGVTWNFLSSGTSGFNSIPVGIIERIEIIKGPASSVWGSSLGGVINVVTRTPGDGQGVETSISTSYGERNSRDWRAQVSGRAGKGGFFLFAGLQASDGLRFSRNYDNRSVYSKFQLPFSESAKLTVSAGLSRPENQYYQDLLNNMDVGVENDVIFMRSSLDCMLSPEVKMNLYLNQITRNWRFIIDALDTGDFLYDQISDEQAAATGGQLIWEKNRHTAVLGLDIEKGKLEQRFHFGNLMLSDPEIDTYSWSVYANDVVAIGRCLFTMGLLYDHDSSYGAFISPAVGATCRLEEDSIIRVSMSRGFNTPPLPWVAGEAQLINLVVNPLLEPEKVWSIEAGIESRYLPGLYVKSTVFYHHIENGIDFITLPSGIDTPINEDAIRTRGLELAVKTAPIHHLSLQANGACIRAEYSITSKAEDIYLFNAGIRFDGPDGLYAELFGNYSRYPSVSPDDRNEVIWDLNASRKLALTGCISPEVFLTVHNVFNGSQYLFTEYTNPDRWVEAGIRFDF